MSKKLKVNLQNFYSPNYDESTGTTTSKFIDYVSWELADVAIFIDYTELDLLEKTVSESSHKYKVIVLREPQELMQSFYDWVHENEDLFDLIFVHYPVANLKNPEKYRYYSGAGDTWVSENARKVYNKTKNVTAIWSQKNFGLTGHQLRHSTRAYIKENIPDAVDWNNPINKIDGLVDYRYEIVVENEFPHWLTEKHLDCMLTGTIPIVWGSKWTKQWEGFDVDGMIFFQTPEELYSILTSNMLGEEHYNSLYDSIIHNFHECNKHLVYDNILWHAGLYELDLLNND